MKKLCILLALLLLLGLISACAAAEPKESAAPQTEAPETEAPAAETPRSEAIYLPDFTVQTIDGASFTLSEALRDHELVLINLFASWCPPCKMEFPYLQQVWEQEKDRVAVVALSVEATDDDALLREYAEENGLSFPIGREDGTQLRSYAADGIPTSILVDRAGKVAAVELGAKSSAQQFLELFDSLSGEDYDPEVCTYTICAYGSANYQAVEGAVVNFCTESSCTPVTTTAEGTAVFTGPPARYHVQLVKAPEGWQPDAEIDFYTEPYGQTLWLPFTEAEQ